jgi:Tfp pilus assembly protein PilX
MIFNTHTNERTTRGFLLVLVLVFGAIFFLIASAFIGYVVTQGSLVRAKHAKEQALNIAEAGLNYYRWYLAHYPGDTTNGTTTPGPYVHTYADPEGTTLGEFSLELASSTACGEVYAIDITSTGRSYDTPDVTRTIYGRYARPTVTEYAYIINANVWAGADRTIIGPYHSNGVIRMDGTNNSTVTSGQETWVCDGSMSCSPGGTGSVKDGVYGNGPNDHLWSFPSPPINFTGLTVDLSAMQTKAQTGGGLYFAPSGNYGYRIRFNANGTITVYRVTNTTSYWGYTQASGWLQERHVISSQTTVGTYTIPTSCSVIFVEDKVWLEGVVNGKVTLAAADVDTPGTNPSIILHNNITYATATSGLLAIGEQDVLVGLQVPDDMVLNGIFAAQNGRFGRNHYCESCNDGGSRGLPSALDQYVFRDTLTVNGTIVSNAREGTKWTSGSTYISGFNTRYNSYDRNLVANPPPLTPEVSDTYRFIEWREMD